MKLLLLLGDQNNQHALAQKVSSHFEVIGIVYEKRIQKKSWKFSYLIGKITDKLFFFQIAKSWKSMLAFYNSKNKTEPNIPLFNSSNINGSDALSFIKKQNPDLILVSGTSLLKKELLSLKPSYGIINLHTGLSPYVKGGPNCTNWCIANNTIHLIGNTIMWIDEGIDSGNIITSETTSFNGEESLREIHIKVMEHAHELTIKAIQKIHDNIKTCPSVTQNEIAKGQLFLTNMWGFKSKLKFTLNIMRNKFKKTISDPSFTIQKKSIRTVSLND